MEMSHRHTPVCPQWEYTFQIVTLVAAVSIVHIGVTTPCFPLTVIPPLPQYTSLSLSNHPSLSTLPSHSHTIPPSVHFPLTVKPSLSQYTSLSLSYHPSLSTLPSHCHTIPPSVHFPLTVKPSLQKSTHLCISLPSKETTKSTSSPPPTSPQALTLDFLWKVKETGPLPSSLVSVEG